VLELNFNTFSAARGNKYELRRLQKVTRHYKFAKQENNSPRFCAVNTLNSLYQIVWLDLHH